MAEPVYGSDVVLEMWVEDTYYPVLCATDCVFTTTPEFIEKTGPNSGFFREFEKRIEEFSASVSGLTKIENDATLTFFYLLQQSVRRERQLFRMTFTDDELSSKSIIFYALIGPQSISGPVRDFSQCTIELKGTGSFIVEETSDPSSSSEEDETILSDWWQTVNGQNYISGASSIHGYTLTSSDVLLEVDMEGVQYDLVTSTPADGEQECKFQTSPVRVVFPSDVIFDGSQRVFVLFKRTV